MNAPGRAEFRALGTTAIVLTTDAGRIAAAEQMLRSQLQAIDEAGSRFRTDSEIAHVHRLAGRPVRISPLLAELIAVALDAARRTSGIVDPTVGAAVRHLGYDRDFAAVTDSPVAVLDLVPAPGWHRILLDPDRSEVLVPRGITLDLGASAKAHAADRSVTRIADRLRTGVLVSLGGDIAVSGPAPSGGWQIAIGDDHRADSAATVSIRSGGLATSSTTQRCWRRAGRVVHHIVDPRTGDIPEPVWRTVSVAAGTCVDANAATTASIVMGSDAPKWLAAQGLPALLTTVDGHDLRIAGWPDEERAA